jgi:anti-anti-sigma factor
MRLSVSTLDGILIVRIAGAVDSHTAGRLYDVLVDCVGEGRKKLIVNLSGVERVTHAGVRGLVVAARLLNFKQGEMRICGAGGSVETFLRSLGFGSLLKFDPTLEASVALLSRGTREAASRPMAVLGSAGPAPAARAFA